MLDFRAHIMLASHMALLATINLFGAPPVWSNQGLQVEHHTELERTVKFVGGITHVPGTEHIYRTNVSVTMEKVDGHWIARTVSVECLDPRTGGDSATMPRMTLFPCLEQVDERDPWIDELGGRWLPAVSTKFVIPA